MGRIIYLVFIVISSLLLSGCPLKDWIRADNEYVGVDEFKRITHVVKVKNKKNETEQITNLESSEVSQLFFLLSTYHRSSPQEQSVLFDSIQHSFRQNPTLLNALFLSMIEVTSVKNKDKLAINSNLMNAIDLSSADPDLLELTKLFRVINGEQEKNDRLNNKIKLYKNQNAKYKSVVNELTTQINALKNIDESIFARELVLDNQE